MTKTFRLPDLGEGLTESDIVQWRVSEGDTVKRNDVLAEVETAKATVELPSPFDGVIAKLHAAEGETVLVGAPIVDFNVDGDEPAADGPAPSESTQPSAPPAEAAPAPADEDEPKPLVLVGSGPKERAGVGRRERTWTVEAFVRGATPKQPPVRSMPPVRALARSLGVDLGGVPGTGNGGRVERGDVEQAARGRSVQAPAASVRREPVKGIRKFTAQAMTQAWSIPQATVFHRADATATLDLARSADGVSFFGLVCRAVVLAAQAAPSTNAWFDDEAAEIEYRSAVHLGVAIATERGLVVATVRDAHAKSAADLTHAIRDLAVRGRAGSLGPEELTGSTITVSNVGVFGIDAGVPILNPGQSAIVAVGAVRRQPWEFDGSVALRHVMELSCSFDHRVIDGAEGAGFLLDVATLIERPERAMLR